MAIFTGFGSPKSGPVQLLQDVDLIKQDLTNHFMTQKGERIMDATYGFIGWDLIFELKTPGIKEAIEQDARRIVQSEPRVTESNITVVEEEHGFQVQIDLRLDTLETISSLRLFFDERRLATQV